MPILSLILSLTNPLLGNMLIKLLVICKLGFFLIGNKPPNHLDNTKYSLPFYFHTSKKGLVKTLEKIWILVYTFLDDSNNIFGLSISALRRVEDDHSALYELAENIMSK